MQLLNIVLVLSIPSLIFGLSPQEMAQQLGIWTLLPPFLAVMLAFLTKHVILSLFVGIWIGALLLVSADGFSFYSFIQSFTMISKTIVSSINSSFSAGIIMQVVTIGGLIALIGRNGGARAVASLIASKAKTPRSAQLMTWILGLFIFFDDYANALIAGSVMRPVTDKLKISREKLAFIVDSTAAPVAAIALISTWIGFELSTMRDAYDIIGQSDVNVYAVFLKTIPYRFYNIFMLGFVVIIALMNRDFGPMLKAEQNARNGIINNAHTMQEGGDALDPLPHVKLNIWNALIPLATLIVVSILGFWNEGYQSLMQKNADIFNKLQGYDLIIEILGASSASFVIFQAALAATIVAFIMSAATKTINFFDAFQIWLNGAKNLFGTAVLTLILAWSISSIIKALGTNFFLVEFLKDVVNPALLPMFTFIIGMLVSFSTGTSYGTMGILMPLAIPLASSLSNGADIIVIATAGAALTGAVFGDHCSPISDSTILSSAGAGCSLVDHTKTQLPYALLVGFVSIMLGYLMIAFGFPILVSYILGFLLLISILYVYGKNPSQQ